MHHPELGRRILDQVVTAVEHLGKVEIFPRQDGRNMTMVLGPDRKAQAAAERAKRQAQADAPRPASSGAPAEGGEAPAPESGATAEPATEPTEPTTEPTEPTSEPNGEPTPVTAAHAAEAGQPAPQETPSDD